MTDAATMTAPEEVGQEMGGRSGVGKLDNGGCIQRNLHLPHTTASLSHGCEMGPMGTPPECDGLNQQC
eukprot:8348389-Alexandrium_andersonii.AAC.1